VEQCVELAEQINECADVINFQFNFTLGPSGDAAIAKGTTLIAQAVRDARRLDNSMRRVISHYDAISLLPGNHTLLRVMNRILKKLFLPSCDSIDEMLSQLAKFEEHYNRYLPSKSAPKPWVAYAELFTPLIVQTLREAGWSHVSKTSQNGPTIALLCFIIGTIRGDALDPSSLSRVLRRRGQRKN
jgi:hypothetical protein